MVDTLLDILLDTIIDTAKLLPFLFITYLAMEYIEHKAGNKMQVAIKRSGHLGPAIGGFLGAFPQCGFSAAASNLYAGRIITIGTLLSVYLSTSDEMLPIMISSQVPISIILKVLGIKIVCGMICGFLVDLIYEKIHHKKIEAHHIDEFCQCEKCHCDDESILKSALHHTLEIVLYIFVLALVVSIIVELVGEETLAGFILNRPILGPVLAGIIGLIPNCGSSVVITQLYINGLISASSLISGLLVGSGMGLFVLFRVNRHIKENLAIVCVLYILGVVVGILLAPLAVLWGI